MPLSLRDVISVRFHADAAPLARVIDHGLAMLRAPSACGAEVEPPPEQAGMADAVRAASLAACAAVERRSAAGTCEPAPLAPEDEAFQDTHGGADWGNRCVLHLRAGDLDAAAAACARGLALAQRPSTRGALLYNLGRVAQARGDIEGARRVYQASLRVRPGNAPTQAALDALAVPAP